MIARAATPAEAAVIAARSCSVPGVAITAMPATNAAAAIPNNAERPGVVAVANCRSVFRESAATVSRRLAPP